MALYIRDSRDKLLWDLTPHPSSGTHPCSPVPLVPGSPGASHSSAQSTLAPSTPQTYAPQTHLPTPQQHTKCTIVKTSLTALLQMTLLPCAALIILNLQTPLCSSHPSALGCEGRVSFKPLSLPSIKITDFPPNNGSLGKCISYWGGGGGTRQFNHCFWCRCTAWLCISN